MIEGEEECELQQLVPSEEEHNMGERCGEITPPVTPTVSRLAQRSPAPSNTKTMTATGTSVSSNRGPPSQSSSNQSSRSISRIASAPSAVSSTHATSSGVGGGYLHEKLRTRPPRPLPPQISTRNLNVKRDVTDVRRMETALLHLLEDFHSGKLRAFGKDCSMEQMTGIREQQERLARLHFELGAQQELFTPLSEEGLRQGSENMSALMTSLEQLSESIERLHSFNS
ncbi:coiled-coil domain-containing protein 28B-like isoform X2 [Macrosteles quadrilineatus]|uniref:coiled-coil domain-containing protein 28B-like isoform X2 n=1 Tax=Macrosteles quadrilineatus TaxID=74068 RepID=UPI0023E1BFBC|nr:coiled-coil domain-containing protein 28B-like isoform X2 [Macrosteles quadrilineatus]XP_054273173.1 coiled-coil domain-containing protein 28B-like isoform X2 [Macrosteles quadrilineatus]